MGAVVFSEPPYVTPDRNIIFCSMVIPRFNGDIDIACSLTVFMADQSAKDWLHGDDGQQTSRQPSFPKNTSLSYPMP